MGDKPHVDERQDKPADREGDPEARRETAISLKMREEG
jgi:hypothetical protein